jgi:hypothetical protein
MRNFNYIHKRNEIINIEKKVIFDDYDFIIDDILIF